MQIRRARAEDAAGIARVQVDSWQTTYVGIVADDFLQQMKYETYAQRWVERLRPAAPLTAFVAVEASGEIVGFVSGGAERSGEMPSAGELYAIYLLQQAQHRGIGRRLVRTLAEQLLADGKTTMLVWVLTDNRPARAFYEKLGATYVSAKQLELGGELLDEVSYVWKDLRELLVQATST